MRGDEDWSDPLMRLEDCPESRVVGRRPLLLSSRSCVPCVVYYLLLNVSDEVLGIRYPHAEQATLLFGFALDHDNEPTLMLGWAFYWSCRTEGFDVVSSES